jgi:hypothetical protein
MDVRTRDVRLAGSILRESRHVCAFFNSRTEEHSVVHPFIAEGLERSEKALYLVDPAERDSYLSRLREIGPDTESLLASGQLEVRSWQETYLRGGHFDFERILSLFDQTFAESAEQGFPLTRVWANMEWALLDPPDIQKFVEYEAKFNYVSMKYPSQVTVCVYDASKFGAALVLNMLRVHPVVILGGTLRMNPFYVNPDEFLRELGSRS